MQLDDPCKIILDDFKMNVYVHLYTIHCAISTATEDNAYIFAGRSHWGAALDGKKCANQICQTHFGLFERPRNCHRLAETIC